jgi:HPt (histidine-containing phosphotransfer) domain-containing protein
MELNCSPAVIDMRLIDSIRSLNADGRPDLLAELVSIFKETSPGLLEALEESTAAGDQRALQRLAHRLKGGSGNVGARHMARLCAELENLAKETPADAHEIKRYVDAIRQSYSEALGALGSLL